MERAHSPHLCSKLIVGVGWLWIVSIVELAWKNKSQPTIARIEIAIFRRASLSAVTFIR